jgi:hypothetical protein
MLNLVQVIRVGGRAVEVLRYKSEDRGFDSRFFMELILPSALSFGLTQRLTKMSSRDLP